MTQATDGINDAAACADTPDGASSGGEKGDAVSLPPPAFPTWQRKNAILAAACDHFGRFGFRGTSLRDIARDAGVSLTLLNHHFDNKAGLLWAVVADNREMLRRRTAEIKRLRSAGLGVIEPVDLVRAWITDMFEAASSRQGRRFLRMLAHLDIDGSDEVATIRERLDEDGEPFIQALLHCYPGASRQAATAAYLCINASMLRIAASVDSVQDEPEATRGGATDVLSEWLERFLLAGIDATLSQSALRPDATNDQAEEGTEWRSMLAHS